MPHICKRSHSKAVKRAGDAVCGLVPDNHSSTKLLVCSNKDLLCRFKRRPLSNCKYCEQFSTMRRNGSEVFDMRSCAGIKTGVNRLWLPTLATNSLRHVLLGTLAASKTSSAARLPMWRAPGANHSRPAISGKLYPSKLPNAKLRALPKSKGERAVWWPLDKVELKV